MNSAAMHRSHLIPVSGPGIIAPEFKAVFEQYYGTLCYYAERLQLSTDDAEDVVSGVFLKLWNREEPFRDLQHLQAFLYRSTRNACLDHLKQTTREKERQLVFLLESEHFGREESAELIRLEVLRAVYLEIKNLPEQMGKIISMSYIEGRKNEEIAAELGLSMQTIKNQKSRALAMLRLRLPAELFTALLLFSAFR